MHTKVSKSLISKDIPSQTPFYPVPDESIHSYVLRLTILNGINNFSSIIYPRKVLWHPRLVAPPQVKKSLELVNRLDLYSIIKRSLPNESFYTRMTDIDYIYQSTLSKRNRGLSLRNFPINFCKQCLKEQVNTFGFAYFRQSWSFYDKCVLHDAPLYTLAPASPKKFYQSIRKVLSLSFEDVTTVTAGSLPKPERWNTKNIFSSKFFAPCVEPFAKDLLWEMQLFPYEYVELIDHSNFARELCKFIRKLKYKSTFTRSWNYQIKNCDPRRRHEFTLRLFDSLELISTSIPAFSECYKVKHAKCDKCTFSCPASKRLECIDNGIGPERIPIFIPQMCDERLDRIAYIIDDENKLAIDEAVEQKLFEDSKRQSTELAKK